MLELNEEIYRMNQINRASFAGEKDELKVRDKQRKIE